MTPMADEQKATSKPNALCNLPCKKDDEQKASSKPNSLCRANDQKQDQGFLFLSITKLPLQNYAYERNMGI